MPFLMTEETAKLQRAGWFAVLPLKHYSDICMKVMSVLSLYLIVQTPSYLHDFTSEMTE